MFGRFSKECKALGPKPIFRGPDYHPHSHQPSRSTGGCGPEPSRVTQAPSTPAVTCHHPCLFSPTFSGFLLCHLSRFKASRAPAKTCCQARPDVVSERVSQRGEELQRGAGFLVGIGAPSWPQLAQSWSRAAGSPPWLCPFSGSPRLQMLPSPPEPKGNGGQGWTLRHSWSGPPVMPLWLAAGTHHPKDPLIIWGGERGSP